MEEISKPAMHCSLANGVVLGGRQYRLNAKHTKQPAANDGHRRDHVDVAHLEPHDCCFDGCGEVFEEDGVRGERNTEILIPCCPAEHCDRRRIARSLQGPPHVAGGCQDHGPGA